MISESTTRFPERKENVTKVMRAAQAASRLLASKTIEGRETGEGRLSKDHLEALRALGGKLIDIDTLPGLKARGF